MIIKNPYGFIAKHYKLINLLLLVPMLYLLLKFGDIATFFKDFVRANYSTPETDFANTYVTSLTNIVIIGMLLINLAIYIILLTKKRNSMYFLFNAGYSIILLISALLSHATMTSIQNGNVNQTFINFVRDFANLSRFPMYILLIIGASNGLGFNFKTLKFDKKIELQVHEDEEEDIEIRLNGENTNFKKNFVHMLRELKYYILENKFVFTCFAGIFIIVIGVSLFLNFRVYNKTYDIKQAFSLNNFTISLKDSYITDVDYRGITISKDKYFLALKIGIQNKGIASKIDGASFRLYVGDEIIYPSYDRSSRFIDIGRAYKGDEIATSTNEMPGDDYVFVYELTKEQIKNSYQIRILNSLTQKETKLMSTYKTINIKPQNILKNEIVGNYKVGNEISLSNSILSNTTYKLNRFEIASSYQYEYDVCESTDKCVKTTDVIVPHGGNILIVLSDEIKWDETTSYYKNSTKDFYADFVTLQYDFNSSASEDVTNTYQAKLKNVTSPYIKDKKIYEVPSNLFYSNKYSMIIKIRNKIYIIDIK